MAALAEALRHPIRAGQLRHGVPEINTGYNLAEVMRLIYRHSQGNVVVHTSTRPNEMRVVWDRFERWEGYDLVAERGKIIPLAEGKRQVFTPRSFLAILPVKTHGDLSERSSTIHLYVRKPQWHMRSLIKRTLHRQPRNWHLTQR